MSRTVIVLGATSAIAIAYCRRLAPGGGRFVLVGRRLDRLQTIAADLMARGAAAAEAVVSDLADMTNVEQRFAEFCQRAGVPDEVLVAYGVLGDQKQAEADAAETRRLLDTNFVSAALWLHTAGTQLADGKPRTLIVLGSVAGDRGRMSNYVYGSAKAGLDAFCEGLAHRLHGTGPHVLTVKPGWVDTPMTAAQDRSGPLWAKPERVASDIDRAVRRRQRVLYTPWFWHPIMAIVRLAPRALFYRTKL
jgi:short-subunit dehydrogenase